MHFREIRQFLVLALPLALATLLGIGCSPGEPKAAPPVEAPKATDSAAPTQTAPQRPNVVFMILDTLRADGLGVYGAKVDSSPVIDALAKKGVVFDTVLAQCTWTRPSIGALLTGHHPRELGLFVEENEILNDRFTTLAEVMKENGYTTYGMTANPNINTSLNFHQGFDTYVDSNVLFPWQLRARGETKLRAQPLPAARDMLRATLEFLDKETPDGPVYLQFNFMEPHEWAKGRGPKRMLRDEYWDMFDKKMPYAAYYRLVRQMTDDIGVFIEALSSRPGWEDALYVFVSDHGEGLGNHPHVKPSSHHGKLLYESQARVPWIMYRKGWTPARQRVAQDVRLLDVMPTLLDYLGIDAPKEMAGLSLMPVVRGEQDSVELPDYFFLETYFKGADMRAVYATDHKYIHSEKRHKGLLPQELQKRRIKEDGQLTNVLKDHPKIAEHLKARMKTWEEEHPKADPTPATRERSEEEEEQLKAIGYL